MKPKPEEIPEELRGLVIGQTMTGYPTTMIRPDQDWNLFVKEQKEVNWVFTGAQAPTQFNKTTLLGQLKKYGNMPGYAKDGAAFQEAHDMLCDCLFREIGPIHELSLHEGFFGSHDGHLAGLPLDTASGVGWSKLGAQKKDIVSDPEKLDYLLHVIHEDMSRIKDRESSLWAWPTKTSLKDARLPMEKISAYKARVFNGASIVTSVNGRRLLGDFIGKFMKRCSEGNFFGIVSYVLARGGWHDMMMELTGNGSTDFLTDIDVKAYDKDFIRFLQFKLMEAIAALAPADLAEAIMRHYQRVFYAPTLVTILGYLFYCGRGMPSGDIATVIINTLAQALVYMYCYCKSIPKDMSELKSYNMFKHNVRLRLLGDDSASSLQPMYEKMLTKPWYELVSETFGEFGWLTEMPRTPAAPGRLGDDFAFVGHKCIVATVPTHMGMKSYYLPALPFEVLLSINEHYKLAKNREVPEPVRHIGRYYASVERSFPYLFSEDPIEREYAQLAYEWLNRAIVKYRNSPNDLVRATANGVPTIGDLVKMYFPSEVMYGSIEREMMKRLVRDPGRA